LGFFPRIYAHKVDLLALEQESLPCNSLIINSTFFLLLLLKKKQFIRDIANAKIQGTLSTQIGQLTALKYM